MKAKFVRAVVVVAALSVAAHAQDIVGQGQQGVAVSQRAAGPVGVVIGGVAR